MKIKAQVVSATNAHPNGPCPFKRPVALELITEGAEIHCNPLQECTIEFDPDKESSSILEEDEKREELEKQLAQVTKDYNDLKEKVNSPEVRESRRDSIRLNYLSENYSRLINKHCGFVIPNPRSVGIYLNDAPVRGISQSYLSFIREAIDIMTGTVYVDDPAPKQPEPVVTQPSTIQEMEVLFNATVAKAQGEFTVAADKFFKEIESYRREIEELSSTKQFMEELESAKMEKDSFIEELSEWIKQIIQNRDNSGNPERVRRYNKQIDILRNCVYRTLRVTELEKQNKELEERVSDYFEY